MVGGGGELSLQWDIVALPPGVEENHRRAGETTQQLRAPAAALAKPPFGSQYPQGGSQQLYVKL